jgi:hypothetical protein
VRPDLPDGLDRSWVIKTAQRQYDLFGKLLAGPIDRRPAIWTKDPINLVATIGNTRIGRCFSGKNAKTGKIRQDGGMKGAAAAYLAIATVATISRVRIRSRLITKGTT